MRTARALATAGIIVVASLLGGAPQPAGAIQFTIAGLVTDAGGSGVPNVLVYLYEGGSGATCCTPVTGATTQSTGAYVIQVDAGTYRVRFYPPSGYVEEWYNNASDFGSAADLDLTSSNATGIDAPLTQGSKITGTVTASGGGGLSGVGVHAFKATGACCDWVTGTTTDASGAYSLTLANGTYRLLFYVESGLQLSEWFDNAADFDTATDLVVAGADQTGKNAQLITGQTISGTVTSSTGSPLADVFVGAFKNTTCCEWVGGTQTDGSGNYTLAVADGSYRLMFYPWSGNALMEWWDNADSFETATPITISGASVAGKNAQLTTGMSISGTVTGSGVPLENVFVGAFKASGLCCEWVNGTGTDSLGNYSITVPNGTYRIMFYPYDGTHLGEWWDNAASFETAINVVVNGADVTGKNATLATGTKISGTVTGGGGPLEGVFVGAYDASPGAVCCTWVAGTGTNSLGEYDLAVPNGTYRLMFYPFEGAFLSEWWDNKADFESATNVVVSGTDVTGKDAQLATGFAISGTVTAVTGGAMVEGVGVTVIDATTGNWISGAFTNAAGAYSAIVGNGTYKLNFQPPPGLVSEWYNDKATFGLADSVTVSGANVPGRNAALASGKVLSGTVSDASGVLPGAGVQLYQGGAASCAPPVFLDATGTNALGNYSFTVAAGDYRLFFAHQTHVNEWFDDKTGCSTSTTVTVSTTDVTGKNAVLANAYPVSGMVTSSGGGALAGIQVELYAATADAAVDCGPPTTVGFATTAADGTYSASVPNGDYRIAFFDVATDPGHQNEYWQNVTACTASTSITVSGAPVTGKDAVLAVTYNVTGTVTNAATTNAISGASVVAWLGGSVFTGANTAADGTYRLDLPAGNYTIEFNATGCTTEWWNEKTTSLNADVRTVSAAVASVNATLGCP